MYTGFHFFFLSFGLAQNARILNLATCPSESRKHSTNFSCACELRVNVVNLLVLLLDRLDEENQTEAAYKMRRWACASE